MADDESRAARQRALAEKKRRLEEIKARRRQPGGGAAAPSAGGDAGSGAAKTTTTTTTTSSTAAAAAGLDGYIDDLLKSSAPGLTLAPAPAAAAEAPSTAPVVAKEKEAVGGAEASEEGGGSGGSKATSAAATPAAAAAPPRPKVETFEIAVQCEDDDFPPPSLVDEDDVPGGDEDEASDDDDENKGTVNDDEKGGSGILPPHDSTRNAAALAAAAPLTEEERAKALSAAPFAQFLSTASKRVERLLGAGEESLYGILGGSGWGGALADFSADYAREEEEEFDDDDDDEAADGVGSGGGRRKKRSKKKAREEAYQRGGFFSARATYEFTKFTGGRDVTDIEWCPGHREWILASYGSVNPGSRNADGGDGAKTGGLASSDPSTRHLSPNDPSSSFLQNFSSAIPDEGIVAIYNLSMPSRPEHIFSAGCPIAHSRFHPTEHPKLVLGGASSGQVLVWDARAGRYPVQRSGAMGGGHDCGLVGMGVLGDDNGGGGAGGTGSMSTSKLVTASSDGKVNYWSVSNLREPVEHVRVDANLSCLEVLHGSNNEGVVCGDERGGLHVVLAGSGRDGSGGSKRVVRTLHPGGTAGAGVGAGDLPNVMEEDADAAAAAAAAKLGHYGMVTAAATRPVIQSGSPRGNKETTSSSMGGGATSKGFLRSAGGLMVTTGVDWSTKLWAPAYGDGPLMSFLSNSYDYMCDVQWSPVHPSVFATASSNGTVNVWNLASSLDQPVSGTEGVPVDRLPAGATADSASSRRGLNRLRWSADGRRMAVASGDKLHVLGVAEEVWKSKGDEEGRVMHNLTSRGLIQE